VTFDQKEFEARCHLAIQIIEHTFPEMAFVTFFAGPDGVGAVAGNIDEEGIEWLCTLWLEKKYHQEGNRK
jgi:hypothetical protein